MHLSAALRGSASIRENGHNDYMDDIILAPPASPETALPAHLIISDLRMA